MFHVEPHILNGLDAGRVFHVERQASRRAPPSPCWTVRSAVGQV